jgi:DNA invertase Pin-like site-specific DNA recombinase
LRDLITMLDDLRERGVKFLSLTEAIDSRRSSFQTMSVSPCSSFFKQRSRAGVWSSVETRA